MKKKSSNLENITNNKSIDETNTLNKPELLDEYYSIMSKLVDIDIKDEWKNNVKFHITNAAKMAQIIENCPIDENSIDLSNTFHPGEK